MMYPTGRYNLNFDISAALLGTALLVMYFLKKDKSGIRSRIYCIVCILIIITSLSEVTVLVMRNTPDLFIPWLSTLMNMISHLSHNMLAYMFFTYLIYYIGAEHYLTRKKMFLFSIPIIVLAVLLVVPGLRNLVYYDAPGGGEYYHGPLYCYFYFETLFYFVCSVYLIAKWHQSIGRYGIFFTLVLSTGGIIMLVSMHWKYLKISNFILALLGLLAFYVVEENTSITDQETGLLNASAFTRDSHVLFGNNAKASVIAAKVLNPDYYRLTYGSENFLHLKKEVGSWFAGIKTDNTGVYSVEKGIITIIVYGEHEDDAMNLAERVRQRFMEPWTLTGYEVRITAEVWLAHIPEHIKSHEQLLNSVTAPADPASRRDTVLIANAVQRQQRRISVARAIGRALENHTFQVYYQPIYDTRTNGIHSAEALIRLNDPELGFISPEEFIKIAEQDGTINEIGLYVFEEVCRFYVDNQLDRLGIDFVEVNLSTIQCMDANLADQLRSILQKYHLDVSHIDLEITESALIHDRDQMNQTINRLKEIGFTFSLDDFGTGFSNYEYVITFPFTLIKIDKSILWAADRNPDNDLVLAHTIQMCQDLNRGIVVEGVETEEQKQKLIDRQVEYLQGFYYSRPVPGMDFINYVKRMNQFK